MQIQPQENNTTFQNSTQSNSFSSDGATGAEFARSIALVVNKCRVGRGFNKLEGDKLDDAIATWLEVLVFNRIPRGAIGGLYLLAQQTASKAIQNGKDEPPITVNYLVAVWANGGRDEYYKRVNADKKQIETTENPGEGCPRCQGNESRRAFVFDEKTGRVLGLNMRGFCDHARLKPGEPLFEKFGGDPRDLETETEKDDEEIF